MGIQGNGVAMRPLVAAPLLPAYALSLLLLCCETATAESGVASWYSLTSLTASGERCDPNSLTAAHPSLPFGTKVRVKNLTNGRTITVRVNDRGPFVDNRIIDLTREAARKLDFVDQGITRVHLTVVR